MIQRRNTHRVDDITPKERLINIRVVNPTQGRVEETSNKGNSTGYSTPINKKSNSHKQWGLVNIECTDNIVLFIDMILYNNWQH